MTKKLEDALGLRGSLPMVMSPGKNTPVLKDDTEELNYDIDAARDNIHDAIGKIQSAVEDVMNIAQQSQHPKAYDTLNSLLKTYASVSIGLAELQMKKQRLDAKKNDPDLDKDLGTGNITNNNLFVGSTSEILKMLDDLKKDKGDV